MSGLQKHTQESLEALTRRELQDLAKTHGVKANKKSAIIIEELLELKAQEEEVEDEDEDEDTDSQVHEDENEDPDSNDEVQAPSPTQENENQHTSNAKRRAEDEDDEDADEEEEDDDRNLSIISTESGILSVAVPSQSNSAKRRRVEVYQEVSEGGEVRFMRGDRRVLGEKPIPPPAEGSLERSPTPYRSPSPQSDDGYGYPYPHQDIEYQGGNENRAGRAVTFYDGPGFYDDGSSDKENEPGEEEADKENQPSAEEGEKENLNPAAQYEEPEWLRHYNLYGVIPVSPEDPSLVVFSDDQLQYPPMPPISAPMGYINRSPRVVAAVRERERQHWAALRRRLGGATPYPPRDSQDQAAPQGEGSSLDPSVFKTPSPRPNMAVPVFTRPRQSLVPRASPERRSPSGSPDEAANSLRHAGGTPHPSRVLRARETPRGVRPRTSEALRTPSPHHRIVPVFTRPPQSLVPPAGPSGSPDRVANSQRHAGGTPHPSRVLRVREAPRASSDALRAPSPSQQPTTVHRVLTLPRQAFLSPPGPQMSPGGSPVSPQSAFDKAVQDLKRDVLDSEGAIEVDPMYAEIAPKSESPEEPHFGFGDSGSEAIEREVDEIKQEWPDWADTIEYTKLVLEEQQEIVEAVEEVVKDCKEMLRKELVWKLCSLEKNVVGRMKTNTTIVDGTGFMENEKDKKKWRKWHKEQWEKKHPAYEDSESEISKANKGFVGFAASHGDPAEGSGRGRESGQDQSVSVSSGSEIIEESPETEERYYEQFEEFKVLEQVEEDVPATADPDEWDDMYV